eukprot:gene46011-56316_t
MTTAFVATYGSGYPTIGILAEMDALPGLSQEAVPYRKANSGGALGLGKLGASGIGHVDHGAGDFHIVKITTALRAHRLLRDISVIFSCTTS